jgi:pimeloyl-ACP methyl ester carboxylesterase
LTQFYEAPDPLPTGKPGSLIRFEQAYDYHLSYEAEKYRILYHSLSPQGKDVAATGVVLVPDGKPPKGGWPVIAWAHDFMGSARQCAPSLSRNLNEGPLISMYASIGYAVVATDYAGLGTGSPYAAMDTRSNAQDVMNAISAARAALPELGTNWVAVGYSQGANVAIGVAEALGETGATGYLGAIGMAGVAEPQEMFEHFAGGPDYFLLVALAGGIQTVFPEFRPEEMLTERGMQAYKSRETDCGGRAGSSTVGEELLRSGWENNTIVKEFFARNAIGGRRVSAPLLVISGEADPVVPSTLTAKVVAQLCGQKDRLMFVKYPGSNASEVLSNSLSEQISWIRARFSGLPAPSNCP